METTEKIVECYCRYVNGWFTIPNIKCEGQKEIDLLAVDATTDKCQRYHIESGVSISGNFSKLTADEFSIEKLRTRTKQAGQRRTIGYFIENKFKPQGVLSKLEKFGFKGTNYTKVIVTWGYEPEAKTQADRESILLWDFREILKEIGATCRNNSTYFSDDTLRTIQLFLRSFGTATQISGE